MLFKYIYIYIYKRFFSLLCSIHSFQCLLLNVLSVPRGFNSETPNHLPNTFPLAGIIASASLFSLSLRRHVITPENRPSTVWVPYILYPAIHDIYINYGILRLSGRYRQDILSHYFMLPVSPSNALLYWRMLGSAYHNKLNCFSFLINVHC